MRKYSAVVLVAVFIFSCDPPGDHRLKYVNNSDKYLLLHWGFDEPIPIESPFKDMRESYRDPIDKENADVLNYYRLVKPHQVKMISTGTGTWDSFFQGDRNRKLTIHLFDFQNIEAMRWDSIREKNLYYEKYTLSLDSLERVHWTIGR